jgi:hypothetical protein
LKKTTLLSKSLDMDMSENAFEDDEDTPANDGHLLTYVSKSSYSINYLYSVINNFPCVNNRVI